MGSRFVNGEEVYRQVMQRAYTLMAHNAAAGNVLTGVESVVTI